MQKDSGCSVHSYSWSELYIESGGWDLGGGGGGGGGVNGETKGHVVETPLIFFLFALGS